MGPEIFAPFTVFGAVVLVFWIIWSYGAKKRQAELDAVRSIVEKTGEASPELIRAIGKPRQPKNADLRKGLVLLALAGAFVGLGFMVSYEEEEALRALTGVAMFPGLVGLVFVILHFMGGKDDD